MLKLEKILLPIDFQNPSASVIHQASTLAHRFHLEVILLHVVTPFSYAAGMLEGAYVPKSREDLLEELIRQARKELDSHLKPEFEGLRVKRTLRKGDPASEIVECARAEDVSVIMMPTHGYRTFKRFLLGSVVAKVLHDSPLPVWTGGHLGEPSEAPFTLKHIVCGVDLDEHSRSTIHAANHLAASFQAQLTLVHITPILDVYAPAPEWRATLAALAAKQIDELQASMGTSAQVVIDSGDAARQLNQTAIRLKADLLVVGRNPSTGHFGRTGYGIIRESHIPVLSIRASPDDN